MRIFIASSVAFFLTLSPIVAQELNPGSAAVLETTIRTAAPVVRASLVDVGRTGLADVRAGVLLGRDGFVLCPKLEPIDGKPVPYLVYGIDGSRVEAETIWENEEALFAMIRISNGVPEGKVPASTSMESPLVSSWFLIPAFPPAVLPGDVPQLHLGHLISAEKKTLGVHVRSGGNMVFDLAGRLVGVTTKRLKEGEGFETLWLKEMGSQFPEVGQHIPAFVTPTSAGLPFFSVKKESETEDEEAPEDPARDALAALAKKATADVPVVAIFNHAGVSTTGVHGLIIGEDGLILSKASEIGPSPMVQYKDESYPAVLIATDDATDLALLSIEATDLPVVEWSDSDPGRGTLLHSPQVHTAPPFNFTTASGLLSHRLPEHPAASLSIHSPERITSLGIIPEQRLDELTIAAILPDGPAAEAKLERGDVLVAIDGMPIPDRRVLREWLEGKEVGTPAKLKIARGGEEQTVSLKLAAAHLRLPVTEPMFGETRTSVIIATPSIRRSGFPETLVHDLKLEPWQIGSPLCDSQGQVIGMNIATVTFDRCLALPVPTIKKAIARMQSKPVSF